MSSLQKKLSQTPDLANNPKALTAGYHNRQRIGGVTVTMTVAHLDNMPRCHVCGRAVCSHSDMAYAGLVPAA